MLSMRAPCPSLRRFVRALWASEPAAGDARAVGGGVVREHVVPTGEMHLVLRLSGPPLRLFAGPTDTRGWTVGHALVGGARSRFHARDVSQPAHSVGVQLLPGAAQALFGLPADALAEQHVPLDALWGASAAGEALERVHAPATAEGRMDALQALLLERLDPWPQALHPAIAQALARLGGGATVGSLAAASGYSHRRFIALFREATGLAPKRLERVQRLQRVLATGADRAGALPWAELALQAGYGDQSHLHRDFVEITGLTPQAWRRAAPASPNHVRVD
ncbi:AraC family transcriptional regulator [Variovorax sp. J22P168]|uniref:helix-turn-helix domain-containing protein n=1 Tax=Variovorax jilinensis TaxID=3053513 RepID=UPI0025767B89|nr:AraC family transcriptional regulator [Variovorax sp. J22P168]MDM0013605.1 AraC family transcriptional regulator [Variovorax sp. J22P168]